MSNSKVAAQRDDKLTWLNALRVYFGFVIIANLAWEIVQLPLYTIWSNGTVGEIVFAVAHCTGGDVLIAAASSMGALLLFGSPRWPSERYMAVATVTIASGVAYTIFSEWLNTKVRGSWAYSELMPILPLFDAGLSPVAQWIVIPTAGFWLAHRWAPAVQP